MSQRQRAELKYGAADRWPTSQDFVDAVLIPLRTARDTPREGTTDIFFDPAPAWASAAILDLARWVHDRVSDDALEDLARHTLQDEETALAASSLIQLTVADVEARGFVRFGRLPYVSVLQLVKDLQALPRKKEG